EVRGVIVDEQVDEIRALPDSDVPPGLRETLTGSDVDVLDAVSAADLVELGIVLGGDRKSTRLNSSHVSISYAVFCLKKKMPQSRSVRGSAIPTNSPDITGKGASSTGTWSRRGVLR